MADVQAPPSHMRTVPGSVNVPVAKFPHPSPTTDVKPEQVASDVVDLFNKAIDKGDLAAVVDLFDHEGFWRDHLALSWSFQTHRGTSGIQEFLKDCAGSKDGFRLKSISLDKTSDVRKPGMAFLDHDANVPCLVFFFTLQTTVGTGDGVARLIHHDDKWKVFTFYTVLQEIKGHEEAVNSRRDRGVEHGGKPGRKNWVERRQAEAELEPDIEPAVLILGAGQAGLTISARLKAIGITSLMVDQNDRIGDNWRKRYHQLVLHDPVWYDHLPYIKFPPQWPVFTPKDKLAEFFESYAKLLELNAWMKTTITDTQWHEDTRVWDITIRRTLDDGTTQTRTLHPRHVIQATGHSGKKNLPVIRGASSFEGHLLCHSSEFPGARASVTPGTRAIVVGSCNSGHDIAQDFVERGYDVTMVQRSTTCVISSEGITEIALGSLYSETSPPVEEADLLLHSLPASVLKADQVLITAKQNAMDRDTIDGLERAGFKVDRGPDDAGLLMKYFQRGGGYYIDVGASRLIVEGRIKIKQGQEITEVLPQGLRFADGSELEADEIVFATGYQNMRTETRAIFGDQVADQVGDIWGYNEEGEQRIIWTKSGHPGFWFHGGNLALCRFFSKLLALQIKGLEEGIYQYGDK
ncbi:indole-3-pyruvate monooxygenase YUCCA1 like protein [Verticillium longisporum]|uniref:Flavin-containing monooxygenase n=3 Tax=Verticillium TaxID=1036719 RepID=G2WXG5_VERDV|nr:uncharacterized protein VDAG_02944 [Verticillium dahliae VdLs.17]KAF3351392.1 D-arabinitol 2-dehydrogenase [ribulose-forming] [Verticillium dahliae VDG2]KAG7132822.1 indole-3-pyruvate monooxygenase YUCCA1 like protein [Verticillium longisporum]KAH6707419.1 hypothetical protein EV126DRAFT_457660 [Verticillium dahliae]EGY21420.1 hypothetical protein VDAG_02944 [Verticillium dahliae VdLs.17]PNH30290.1 hypothetical protein BJF96_g6450 [Verticillium dahliae]